MQYSVLREAHTERPFTGEYVDNHADGFDRCAGGGSELFRSQDKFDSGTGWPSFSRPSRTAVVASSDETLGMGRTEVAAVAAADHLGHVFDDGPTPTGVRYCINSAPWPSSRGKLRAGRRRARGGVMGYADDHQWSQRHLSHDVEGDLNHRARRRLDRHARDCAACGPGLRALRALVYAVQGSTG